MAAIANTYTRYEAIGIREELSDVISNIAPTDTPFQTNAGRGKVGNTFFEWQTDTLAAAVSTNQVVDGNDVTSFTAATPTVRLGNYTEIAQKDVIISATLEATDRAGRESELSYQLAKLGKEIKRDTETALLANKAATAGTTGAARKTGAFKAFLKTNVSKDAGSTAPVYTSTPNDVWTHGSTRAFTETHLKAAVLAAFTQGGDPKTVMLPPAQKQVFSGFAGILELTSAQAKRGQATIVGAADSYVSDFGVLSVMVNRFMPSIDAYIIDWSGVSIEYLRPHKAQELAKTGDAKKYMMNVEYGLRVGNEKAHAIITDLA